MEEKTVFGLWLLVFGSIIAMRMNIIPKTKDHKLKTEKSLWSFAIGLWLDYLNGNEYLTKD
jgi:hypothetical protein